MNLDKKLSEICERIPFAKEDSEIVTWAKEIDRLEIPWQFFFEPSKDAIRFSLPFHSLFPPYVFPEEVPTSKVALKACLAYLLENYEYLLAVQTNEPLLEDFRRALAFKITQEKEGVRKNSDVETFRTAWNKVALRHFAGETPFDFETCRKGYEKLFDLAEKPDQKALVIFYLASLLRDQGKAEEAFKLIENFKDENFSTFAKTYLNAIRFETLSLLGEEQINQNSSETFKDAQSTLQSLESFSDPFSEAFLLEALSLIAGKQGNFSDALRCLTKAEGLYEKMEALESRAQVQIRKAQIYQRWAQEQNPSFYAQALKNYASASKVFTAESSPEVYSDVQLQLAIIYSEKPSEPGKNVMLRSLAIQSFKNALASCDSKLFPLRYANICHNYACALLKFGREIGRNEVEKAEKLIEEALSVRNGEEFPQARAISLLTKIEIKRMGLVENPNKEQSKEIHALIEEVQNLADVPEIRAELEQHRQDLAQIPERTSGDA